MTDPDQLPAPFPPNESGSGSGYSFSDAFETFEEARRWALKYVAPSWWVITPDY